MKSCDHPNQYIDGQLLYVDKDAGGHAYVFCANCEKRVWVHRLGKTIVCGELFDLIEKCDNPPLDLPTLKRLGLPCEAFVADVAQMIKN